MPRKDFKLPAIVPIVLYNGDDNWTPVRTYREYTRDYDIFGDSIINFKYLLFDLKREDKEKFSLAEAILDIIFELDAPGDFMDKMGRLTGAISKFSDDDISMLVGWIIHARFKSTVTPEIEQELKQTLKKGKGGGMRHAIEVLRDESEQRAINRRMLEVARGMRAKGMDVDTVAELTGLTVDDVLQL